MPNSRVFVVREPRSVIRRVLFGLGRLHDGSSGGPHAPRVRGLLVLLALQAMSGRVLASDRDLEGGLDASSAGSPREDASAWDASRERDGGCPAPSVCAGSAPGAVSTPLARSDAPPGLVRIRGLKRTRATTVLELLPRTPPALFSDAELYELKRRLDNLGIFDDVTVMRSEDGIEIALLEKWTLIPMLDLQRGKTFQDTYLLLGMSEYNFLGTASMLSAQISHEERAWNGELSYAQHGYHPGRGAWESKLAWINASYRFEGPTPTSWLTRWIGGSIAWSEPLLHGTFFTYALSATYRHERVEGDEGHERPPSGHALTAELEASWDRYHWTDLAPRGWALTLTATGGGLFGRTRAQDRLELEAELHFAQPLARHTVFMGRAVGSVSSRGNPNFSELLGGLEGVRGLDDALYRNWTQCYLNLELRQSARLFSRLAAQVVLFADTAAYRQLDLYGHDLRGDVALSAGAGARLIPTFLADVLLRVDVARLLVPRREWFVSWGLSQYF